MDIVSVLCTAHTREQTTDAATKECVAPLSTITDAEGGTAQDPSQHGVTNMLLQPTVGSIAG